MGDFDVGSAGVVDWDVVELGAAPAPSAVEAADVGVVEDGEPAEGVLGAASALGSGLFGMPRARWAPQGRPGRRAPPGRLRTVRRGCRRTTRRAGGSAA